MVEDGKEKINRVEEAFALAGGFGRWQVYSFFINTLTQKGAAFFLYSFVFLEKQPIF